MSNLTKVHRPVVRGIAVAFAFALITAGAWAQDMTNQTIQRGPASFDTQVKNAQVVYVEGNDVVLQLDNGRVEHLIVADSDTFTIDGKDVSVNELTPGIKLTQTITTTTAPHYVKTIRTLKGRVWHVNPHASQVFLTVPGGDNQIYNVPRHAQFTINGKKGNIHDIRKGMTLQATIVTDDTQTVIQQSKSIVGQAPPPPPSMPQELGVLLFFQPTIVAPVTPVASVSTEQPALVASTLPKTGSSLPLAGLLGGLAIATSLGLGSIRRAFSKS